MLSGKGYNVVGVKNSWNDPDNAYNGINVKLVSPDGQKCELQFHTPDSLMVKEVIHVLYEKQRVLPKTSPEYKRLDVEMHKISDKQKRPKDIEKL